jgi:heat shock protein HslJ
MNLKMEKMMRKSILISALMALGLLIPAAGCGAGAVNADGSQPPSGGMPALNRPSLAGTQWVLDGYGNPCALTAVIGGSRITLKWNAAVDSISGNAGCNLYGGKANIHDGMMTFSEIYQTEMACLTPGVMEQEMKYLTLLGKAQTWNVGGGKLTIASQGGDVLVYSKDETIPMPLTNLANTKWSLNTIAVGEVASSLIAGTSVTLNFNETATSVGGNGGTNVYGGNCVINGAAIKISNIFSTKMYNDDPPGRMNQESRYFELLAKAFSFNATTAQLTICCEGPAFLIFNAG